MENVPSTQLEAVTSVPQHVTEAPLDLGVDIVPVKVKSTMFSVVGMPRVVGRVGFVSGIILDPVECRCLWVVDVVGVPFTGDGVGVEWPGCSKRSRQG